MSGAERKAWQAATKALLGAIKPAWARNELACSRQMLVANMEITRAETLATLQPETPND